MKCTKLRCYSPVACGGFGYCRELNMRDDLKEWTILEDCKALLEAIDHTVSVHGHMDRGTPLHERLQRTLSHVQNCACKHDWKIWPETDGKSQRCMKCGEYRDTPSHASYSLSSKDGCPAPSEPPRVEP